MKPSFALTFSPDSVGLLHRTPAGWQPVGSVAFDTADLAGALGQLRQSAEALEPKGFAAKLVIPNSEILYTTIRAPGPKAAQRRAQIAAALHGRTPYDVADLVFDWSGTGEEVQVAVVARETLAEAEAFATEHRLNAVSFVAIPEQGQFAAEPWFGQTASAAEVLAPGDKVVRDQDPIRILTRPTGRSARTSAQEAAAEPAPEAPAETVPEALPEVPAAPAAAQELPSDQTAAPVAQLADSAVPAATLADDLPAPSVAPATSAPQTPMAEATQQPEQADQTPAPAGTTPMPDVAAPAVQADPTPVAQPMIETVMPPREAVAQIVAEPGIAAVAADIPPAPELPQGELAAPAAAPALPPALDPVPVGETALDKDFSASAAKGAAAVAAVMDDADQTQAWPGEDDADPLAGSKAALAASLAPAPDMTEAALVAGLRRDLSKDPLPPLPPNAVLRAVTAAREARNAAASAKSLTDKMQKALGKSGKTPKVKIKSQGPAARPGVAAPPPPLPPSASQPHLPPPRTEAEAMTVFGQRRGAVGGKPRFLGFALTGVLLLVLLAIAVWAAMFLQPVQDSAVQPTAPATEQAAGLTSPVPALAPAGSDLPGTGAVAPSTAAPDNDPEVASAEGPTEAPEATQTSDDIAAEPAPGASAVETAVAPEPEAAPAGADAVRTTATTVRGPASEVVDELTLPLPDPALGAAVPARLATASTANADLPPGAPVVLPAFGALFQFDAEGRILPTPDGVITPDGVRLVAGRPARIPPPRPEPAAPQAASAPAALVPDAPAVAAAPDSSAVDPAPQAAAAPAAAPTPPGAIAIQPAPVVLTPTEPEFVTDQRFRGSRPKLRPAGLQTPPDTAPAAAPAENPVAQEGALPDAVAAPSAFAARRPPARPASVLAAAKAAKAAEAEAARQLSEAAAKAAAAASTAAATALAPEVAGLAPTRRPAARPKNFSRAIEAAVAAAIAPPAAVIAPAAPAARTPAPQPERVAATPSRRAPPMGARDDDNFEDSEPEVTSAAPGIPTRASVARQATAAGALDLGRMNLIGVFGTANARHALVRENGGRLVRVKVGDRLDGGRVVAIGQSELSYQRGNNMVQLRMPRG